MTLPIDRLGPESLDALSALVRRSVWNAPSAEELGRCLFPDDQATSVLGDPQQAVVVTARQGDHGFVRLVVVAPDRRRRGLGRALLEAAETDLAGTAGITVGADPPYSLWPGVPSADLALCCALEAAGYERVGANVDMEVDLRAPLPPDPGGWEVAGPEHEAAVAALCAADYPHWRNEALRALASGSLVVSQRGSELVGFCAVDVNRAGTLGPVAVRRDLVGQAAGQPLLIGALRLMKARKHPRAEIVWVGPMRPYAAVGAKVAGVFHVYRKVPAGR